MYDYFHVYTQTTELAGIWTTDSRRKHNEFASLFP